MRNPLRAPNWFIWLAIIILAITFFGLAYVKTVIDKEVERENISRLKRLEKKLDATLKKTSAKQQDLEAKNSQQKMTIDQLQQENQRMREEVGRIDSLRQALLAYGAPIADYAGAIYRAGKKHGVEPAAMCAVFIKESGGGRYGYTAWSLAGWSGRVDESSPEALIDSLAYCYAVDYPAIARGDFQSVRGYCVPDDPWRGDVQSIYNGLVAMGA